MQTRLLERFLRYVAVTSQSDASQAVVPSTEGQRSLAELLKKDLDELGLVNLEISEYSVLTGKLPANLPAGSGEQVPAVGFVAHLDTVDVNLSADIKPQVVRSYSGDICLNEKKGIYLREAEHPELLKYKGQDIVCTDGTSVLGADNKAAIANVVVALETLVQNKDLQHGDIYVAFVPDEECGLRGAKKMDFSKFPVAFAYTIDCCELGEVVYETFNAGSAVVKIKGVSAHPMSAKGVMVNPTLVAVDLINSFDRMQTPEHTEGTEGYIWAKSIISNQSEAVVQLDIRDHNKNTYEARKHLIKTNVESLQKLYPRAEIVCTITDTYGNIADAVNDENRKCIDYIYTAMSELGIKPNTIAMRGGTDGSYISTQGILTPNYFTGGHNFHSNCEFLPLLALEKSCQMTLKLIELIAKG
jgi:tripeptide aminopeptidase